MATSRKAAETSTTPDVVAMVEDSINAMPVVQGFSNDELEMITSWEQAIQAAAQVYGGIIDAQEFEVVAKADLVDKPFLILTWEKGTKTDYMGSEFVIVKAITPDNKKIVFTDGSTGIKDYLLRITSRTGRTGAIRAKHGLRESKYGLTENGTPCELGSPDQVGIGATYYLN